MAKYFRSVEAADNKIISHFINDIIVAFQPIKGELRFLQFSYNLNTLRKLSFLRNFIVNIIVFLIGRKNFVLYNIN